MPPMTAERPQMSLESFEVIAEAAAREDVALEFVNGKIGVKPVPDGDHGEIIRWLQQRCMQHRPDLWLYAEQGLKVEKYRSGDARVDGALAPPDTFAGQGEWASTEGVLMVVEVTSYDRDTDRRDRVEKPAAYAEAGIPVYLLVDRDRGTVTVHSEPERGVYATVVTRAFGHPVVLPAPVGLTLEDTDVLKNYVR
ncbi:Uma2 family endonuclease [Streptomyces sp. P9(2023)]|uniref:Uma2 family endonuclease n=1 Tax=Streptomyces sp. P9(2023) TaxID=3064394 RepID=UPI0028F425B8|nr:Uma2 family endonuclease [Streptomyces sp. P9(2023)]MDT9692637.1 Uma2 family endonuclease [Streptomyces sp. P9(2023)]